MEYNDDDDDDSSTATINFNAYAAMLNTTDGSPIWASQWGEEDGNDMGTLPALLFFRHGRSITYADW